MCFQISCDHVSVFANEERKYQKMKRCPTCRLVFAELVKFCRFDGAGLLGETMPFGEEPTTPFPTKRVSKRLLREIVDRKRTFDKYDTNDSMKCSQPA